MLLSQDALQTVATNFNEKRILKAFYCSAVKNPYENDLFNCKLENIFTSQNLNENDYIQFKNGYKGQLAYYDKLDWQNTAIKFPILEADGISRYFIFANIFSEFNQKTILRTGKGNMKLWLNETLILNEFVRLDDQASMLVELKSGNNLIVAETTENVFALSFVPYEDVSTEEQKYMHEFVKNNIENRAHIVTSLNGSMLSGMVIPRDMLHFNASDKITITVSDQEINLLSDLETNFMEKFCIDIEKATTTFINLECKETNRGSEPIYSKWHRIGDIGEKITSLKSKYEQAKLNHAFDKEYDLNINGRIAEIIKGTMTDDIIKHELDMLEALLINYCSGKSFIETLIEKRCAQVFYHSKLDEREEKYFIALPEHYDKRKAYPMVIFIPPKILTNYEQCFRNIVIFYLKKFINCDCILATLPIKGSTGGSYIGEASYLEALEKIQACFNVDKDRISSYGECNGGSASITIAQAYPHMFSALATISGAFDVNRLCNIEDLYLTMITADHDQLYLEGYFEPAIGKHCREKLATVFFENNGHNSILFTSLSALLPQQLLQMSREFYPAKIRFITDRMRHNRSYWVTVLGFEEGTQYAEVQAEVINDFIAIYTSSVSKLLVVIPPIFNTKKVVIDGKEFSIDSNREQICFEKDRDGKYVIVDNTDIVRHQKLKGMGILDVFLHGLKIVVPSLYASEAENAAVSRIANNLSSPKIDGWDPEIDIQYPIITVDQYDELDKTKSYIYICNYKSSLLNAISHEKKIIFSEDCFEYGNVRYQKDYCIMFISSEGEQDKLFIVYNNAKILKRHIYLRKFVLPHYRSGKSILNNELVIFDGKKYEVAEYIGADLQEV